jgi:hypothetical protein
MTKRCWKFQTKLRFGRRKLAVLEARRQQKRHRQKYRVYFCRACGGYHLTTLTDSHLVKLLKESILEKAR